ncbi:MAG: alpha/beta hydrolase [Polyangia bacterium]
MIRSLAAIRCLATLLVLAPALALAAPPEGKWQGPIVLGNSHLTMGLEVAKRPDGSFGAVLTSLDQGTPDQVADRVTFTEGTLQADFTKSDTRIEGKFVDAHLKATYTQQKRAFNLTMKPVEAFATHARPQEPKRPFSYTEEEVMVTVPGEKGAKEPVQLAGTLTLPAGKGPFPAVLLIGGTQPTDRDGWVARHKPFLVLSDALTKAGIATVRFDDRGIGKSGGASSTLAVHADDTLAELDFLAHHTKVDHKRIGIIARAEGSVVAAMVAAKSPEPRFLVFVAGVGVTGKQQLAKQQDTLIHAVKLDESIIKRSRAANDKLWALLEMESDDAKVREKLSAEMGGDSQMLAMALQQISHGSVALRDWLKSNPKPVLAKVRIPVLALGGDLDLQVDTPTNLAAIAAALKRGGNRHVTVEALPGLNHLMQHAKTGLPTEYLVIEESFAPEALAKISAFVLARH